MVDDTDQVSDIKINLCDDLVVEILSRLPLKPLIKCKCVCKFWRRLCTKLSFRIRLGLGGFYHLSGMDNDINYGATTWAYSPCRLLREYDNNAGLINIVLDLDFFFAAYPGKLFQIVDSCNGILLLQLSNKQKFYVCNSLTKAWVDIRSCDFEGHELIFGCPKLDFDPHVCSHFKVFSLFIEIGYVDEKRKLMCKGVLVFSSENKKWEMRRGVEPYPCIDLLRINGIDDRCELNYLIWSSGHSYFLLKRYAYIQIHRKVVGFNVEDVSASAKEIDLPSISIERDRTAYDHEYDINFAALFADSNGLLNYFIVNDHFMRWLVLKDSEKGYWFLKWKGTDFTSSFYAKDNGFFIDEIKHWNMNFDRDNADKFVMILTGETNTRFFSFDTKKRKLELCSEDIPIAEEIIMSGAFDFRYFFYCSPCPVSIKLGS